MIVGPNPTYDLILPINLSGSFAQSGPGLALQYSVLVSSPRYGSDNLFFNASNFQPGGYSLRLLGLPSNTAFDLKWRSQAAATITDEEWFTDTGYINGVHVGEVHITSVVNHLSGPYSVSGTADFAHTLRFGSYTLTLPDGSPAVGASLVAPGGNPAYTATPEPATFALMLGGLTILWVRRRQNRS